jgi:hypothetical protein
MMKRHLLFLLAFAPACVTPPETTISDDRTAAQASPVKHGSSDVHPGWFKSPEMIADTIANTWQITLTDDEKATYIDGFRALLGGVSVPHEGSLVDRPQELFALVIQSFSVVLAQRLIDKQIAKTASGDAYLFDGLGLALDDDGCYADDEKEWCDTKDGIVVGTIASEAWDVNAPTKAQRKRLMHKTQAIAEFFLMAIDERVMMPGSTQHAPAFLIDDVFLPTLREGADEAGAWREVVATILMSGYFFDLPAEQ